MHIHTHVCIMLAYVISYIIHVSTSHLFCCVVAAVLVRCVCCCVCVNEKRHTPKNNQ